MPSENKPVCQATTGVKSGFMQSVVEDCIKKVEAGKATDGEIVIVQQELDKKTILLNTLLLNLGALEEEEGERSSFMEVHNKQCEVNAVRSYVEYLEDLLGFGKPIEHFHEYDE